MRRRIFRTTLLGSRRIAEGTVEVSVARPEGFAFAPGQHLQLRVPRLLHRDPRGPSRVFSVVSTPAEEDRLVVAFRESGSGYKQTLGQLPAGARLLLGGPYGGIPLPQDPRAAVVLVAGGIGITPFLGILRARRESDTPRPRTTVLYANRRRAAAAYLEELEEIGRRTTDVTVRTHVGPLDAATIGRHGREDEATWAVSGPPAMVDVVRTALHSRGVPGARVHVEEFVGY